jgi:large subunit ribosomal protein L15e
MAEKKIEKAPKASAKKAPQASAHGMYHYMGEAWKTRSEDFVKEIRKKMIDWRAGERIVKLEKPTRLDKARALGYKAKKGVIVFRVTLERGGHERARPRSKRRGKRQGVNKLLRMNYRWIAESRVQKRHQNLEVLNSYLIGKDGRFYFFEVIALDRNAPEIRADPHFNWIFNSANKFRVLHGRTSAGKRARGLRNKSHELKIRPSLRAWGRKGR